jgi:plastocyanin
MRIRIIFGYISFGLAFLVAGANAQGVDVTAQVLVQRTMQSKAAHAKHGENIGSAVVVVWLVPMQPGTVRLTDAGHSGPYRLVQKNKQFTPHLLVVPTGSNIEFPNEDPFFHNVFSLFNGKRFDLGLYESGTSRSVRFDREGVSYIFCNIHPEMGAVVLALSTPYYGISNPAGDVVIHNVPPGAYRLQEWSESGQSANPVDAQRVVQISSAPVNLGQILLQGTANPMENHKNKFGEDYRPTHDTPYQ